MSLADIPATWDTLKIGARVKCIFFGSFCFGKVGEVIRVNQGGIDIGIKWDDGTDDGKGWACPTSFTILQEDIPATWETLKVGCRVKLIFVGDRRHGKTGEVLRANKGDISIKWDDGSDDESGWAMNAKLPGNDLEFYYPD